MTKTAFSEIRVRAPLGGPELNALINRELEIVKAEVLERIPPRDIAAIILGGGYGRGEGGAAVSPDGSLSPFNDYDMFLISENVSPPRKRAMQKTLREISDELRGKLTVDADFGVIKTRRELPRQPFTLMWCDLAAGHEVLRGDRDILRALPPMPPGKLPLREGIFLLLNRGAGLLLAKESMESGEPDAEFIVRNINKALAACGDFALIKEGRHSCFASERVRRFEERPPAGLPADFAKTYREVSLGKLRAPKIPGLGIPELKILISTTVPFFRDFYLDALGIPPKYSAGPIEKQLKSAIFNSAEFHRDGSVIKNIILNCLHCGLTGLSPEWFCKYPRWRLAAALPALLADPPAPPESLPLPGNAGAGAARDKFFKLWRRFN
jgi:hypothetical protein